MVDGNDAWCGVGEGSAVGMMDYEGKSRLGKGESTPICAHIYVLITCKRGASEGKRDKSSEGVVVKSRWLADGNGGHGAMG